MKNFKLLMSLSAALIFSSACTKSANQSEAASTSVKDCGFNILVFSSYTNVKGKMTFDFEEMESWSQESTHDYAIKNNSSVKTAALEILKNGKTLKKIDLSLSKIGTQLTQLSDQGKVRSSLRDMGELKPKMALRFVFNEKLKSTCKKDIEIFVD